MRAQSRDRLVEVIRFQNECVASGYRPNSLMLQISNSTERLVIVCNSLIHLLFRFDETFFPVCSGGVSSEQSKKITKSALLFTSQLVIYVPICKQRAVILLVAISDRH